MARVGRHVEAEAETGEFTLAELRQFVAELDAAGAAGTTAIRAVTGWTGKLRKLKATAVRFGDPRDGGRAAAP